MRPSAKELLDNHIFEEVKKPHNSPAGKGLRVHLGVANWLKKAITNKDLASDFQGKRKNMTSEENLALYRKKLLGMASQL